MLPLAAARPRLSEDLPTVVEFVDTLERIAEFLPVVDVMIGEGLVALARVRVIAYRHNRIESKME